MKNKPGRKPYLHRPNRSTSFILFEDQLDRIERRASAKRISQSHVLRDILDSVFGLDIDLSDIGESVTREESVA